MANIIIQLPEVVGRRVLSQTMKHVYMMMKKYPIFVEFYRELIGHSNSFQYSSRILLDFFLTHLSEFEKRGEESPVILTLFKVLSTQLNLSSCDDNSLFSCLHQLIIKCMRHLFTSSNWSGYLDLLYGCINIIHSQLSKEQNILTKQITEEFSVVEKQVIDQLLRIIQTCTESHIRERVFEIAFRTFIISQYKILFYVYGLAGPESLQQSGMYAK